MSIHGWPYIELDFHLDTNRVNARGRLEAVNELELWYERRVIHLGWSAPVYDELRVDGPSGQLSRKAVGRIVEHPHPETPEEGSQLSAIEDLVFPGGARDDSERNDALALFSAQKYGAIFVTADGITGKPRRILTHRAALAQLGVIVMTDQEAVERVRSTVEYFAEAERSKAWQEGRAVAAWVSQWETEQARM